MQILCYGNDGAHTESGLSRDLRSGGSGQPAGIGTLWPSADQYRIYGYGRAIAQLLQHAQKHRYHHISKGLGMSPSRITISTAGIAKMIRRLADDGVKTNLALSLHAANDGKRNEIMPINDQNGIDILMDALRYFYRKPGTASPTNIWPFRISTITQRMLFSWRH